MRRDRPVLRSPAHDDPSRQAPLVHGHPRGLPPAGHGGGRLTRPVEAAYPGQNGRIAFIKSDLSTGSCPKGSIWTMDADGGGQRELTGGIDLGVIGGVAWSPDGKRIAFTVQTDIHEPLDVMGVLVMDADGGNKTGLVNIPVGADWRCDRGAPPGRPTARGSRSAARTASTSSTSPTR